MKKHIYFVPGTAANSKIFDRILLPEDTFELHFLEWIEPINRNENIQSYAERLCKKVLHKNPIFVGVSFGGIMIQEMSKIIPCERLIIISSIKSTLELSPYLRFIKRTKLYRLAPVYCIPILEKALIIVKGKAVKKQIEAYKTYLSKRDPKYLKWAIKAALHWDQNHTIQGVLHLHGTNDFIFPITYIKNCISIENGSHAMILTKGKKISSILSKNL